MLNRVDQLIRGDLILTVQNLPFPYQMNQCVCKLVEIHCLIPIDGQNRTYSLTVNTVKTAFSYKFMLFYLDVEGAKNIPVL